MADGIALFPSCDLHLVTDSAFAQNQLQLQVLGFEAGVHQIDYSNDPARGRGDVTASCSFDIFPPAQKIITIDSAGLIRPLAPPVHGFNLIQVRFPDPLRGGHHYIVARVQVHETIDGWWFGDDRVTMRQGEPLQVQASVYALFDRAASPPGVVGDITGHGYVTLSEQPDATTFRLDDSVGIGRLDPLAPGDAELHGELLGCDQDLPVTVVADTDPVRPKLDPVMSHGAPDDKLNILFLAEGWPADQERKFNRAVSCIADHLFEKPRHSPFKLLKESFNVWKAFEASPQEAITVATEISEAGHRPIPRRVRRGANFIGLRRLIEIVGLPSAADAGTSVADLRNAWKASQSAGQLADYDDSEIHADVVERWKQQRSESLLQSRDTFFGIYRGARWGERRSRRTTAAAVTEASSFQDFQRRVHTWYRPRRPPHFLTPDPRRHSPLRTRGRRILRYIETLAVEGNASQQLGPLWLPSAIAGSFQPNAGLVCLLNWEDLGGGTRLSDLEIVVADLNTAGSVATELTEAVLAPGCRRLLYQRTPNVDMDFDAAVDTVSHEFGHSFRLGDEYERFTGIGELADADDDNLAHVSEVQQALPHPPGQPTPINPGLIPWGALHRMARSDALLANSTVVSGRMRIEIDPQRVRRWQKSFDEGELDVFVRNLRIRADGRQLPTPPEDVIHVEIRERPGDDGVILLGGLDMPSPVPVFARGSVLFRPVVDDKGIAKQLIEKPVAEFIGANNAPLTDNFDPAKFTPADPEKACELAAGGRDQRSGIPDFEYPRNHFEVIGLYEGGGTYSCGIYRPTGACKMRSNGAEGNEGRFCYVCKYLIVNRVDPGQHEVLDECEYPEDC